MKKLNNDTIKTILILFIIIIVPLFAVKKIFFHSANNNSKAHYVGKEKCISCHHKEYEDWVGSDHDLAMNVANDSTVLGNFNNQTFTSGKIKAKFYKKDGKFFVYTTGKDGKMHEFQISHVFGHYPLQQYLIRFPKGRLQTLSLTWNSKDSNWYYMPDSIYKNENVDYKDWLFWTNQAQNWNSMCADCHSTNVKKNYDLKTDSYNTTYSEINVSCEACHGPGSKHLEWTKLPAYAQKEIDNYGLVVKTSGIDNKEYVDMCAARCHSRRAALSDNLPEAKNIYQHVIPSFPQEPSWFIDGQIKDEDYVYASFTQSRMYLNDVKCNDCHNVHSGKLLYDGNALCLQCHKKEDYDTPRHTFHKPEGSKGQPVVSDMGIKYEVGSGTKCINCHMPGRNYMGVDFRRDHSFRIPRPDLTIKMGVPNACNQCHADKSPQWAESYIEKWYGNSRPFQYGEAFFDAEKGKKNTDRLLTSMIGNTLYPASIRGIAIEHLSESKSNDSLINNYLNASEIPLRIAAIRRKDVRNERDLAQLLSLTSDPVKGIRHEVINKIGVLDTNKMPRKFVKSYKKALAEEFKILKYNSDFPSGKFNLANFYYSSGKFAEAEKLYLEAIKEDNKLNVAKINLAHLYDAIGEPQKAEKILAEYVTENPADGETLYSYGLVLAENRKYEKALNYLIKASKLLKTNGRIDYNIAMIYDFQNKKNLAEKYLKIAINKEPNNYSHYENLLNFYLKNHLTDKAKKLSEKITKLFGTGSK